MTIPNAKTFKNNQQRGKDLEKRFIEWLSLNGYWSHFITPAPDGSQPFDIVAGRNGLIFAFDCKTLVGEARFPLNRVEDNQRMAFKLMNKKGNDHTYFVIEVLENVVRFVPSQEIEKAIKAGKKSIAMGGWVSAYIGCE